MLSLKSFGLPVCRDKSLDLPQDVVSALSFLEEFTHYSRLPRRAVERHVPSYVFDEFRITTWYYLNRLMLLFYVHTLFLGLCKYTNYYKCTGVCVVVSICFSCTVDHGNCIRRGCACAHWDSVGGASGGCALFGIRRKTTAKTLSSLK